MVESFTIKLNATHSHMATRLMEIRFDMRQSIAEIKGQLERKFGTDPECMTLELQDTSGIKVCTMECDNEKLAAYGPQENFTIHVIDSSGTVIKGEFDDVSQVEKYMISE